MALDQLLTQLEINTHGPGFTPLNQQLNQCVHESGLITGVMHLTCLHTSCSLTINENADPRVLKDLAAWMNAMVPQDGAGPSGPDGRRRRYLHDDEGDAGMSDAPRDRPPARCPGAVGRYQHSSSWSGW